MLNWENEGISLCYFKYASGKCGWGLCSESNIIGCFISREESGVLCDNPIFF